MCCKLTTDNRFVYPGDLAFRLHDTHGFPLSFTLDECTKHNFALDWIGYLETARQHAWFDFKTLAYVEESLRDSQFFGADEILKRLKMFVVFKPISIVQ